MAPQYYELSILRIREFDRFETTPPSGRVPGFPWILRVCKTKSIPVGLSPPFLVIVTTRNFCIFRWPGIPTTKPSGLPLEYWEGGQPKRWCHWFQSSYYKFHPPRMVSGMTPQKETSTPPNFVSNKPMAPMAFCEGTRRVFFHTCYSWRIGKYFISGCECSSWNPLSQQPCFEGRGHQQELWDVMWKSVVLIIVVSLPD